MSLGQSKLSSGQLQGGGIDLSSFSLNVICLSGLKLFVLHIQLPTAQIEGRVVWMLGYLTSQRLDALVHIPMGAQRNSHDPAPDDPVYPSCHLGRVIAEAVLEYAEESAVFVERSR